MQQQSGLIAAYYLGLVFLLPGLAFAAFHYLFSGMLGDVWSLLSKIERSFRGHWGDAVVLLLVFAVLAIVAFLAFAGMFVRYRPYAAMVLVGVAAVCLIPLLSEAEFRTAPVVWLAFVMSPISIMASGFVMWKAWGPS